MTVDILQFETSVEQTSQAEPRPVLFRLHGHHYNFGAYENSDPLEPLKVSCASASQARAWARCASPLEACPPGLGGKFGTAEPCGWGGFYEESEKQPAHSVVSTGLTSASWQRLYGLLPSEVPLGAVVHFAGLLWHPELNGHWGILRRWDEESGRWAVLFTGGEEMIAKPENLWMVRAPMSSTDHTRCALQQLDAMSAALEPMQQQATEPAQLQFVQTPALKGSSTFNSSNVIGLVPSLMEESTCSKTGRQFPHECTSVTMRNLPLCYSRPMLMNLLDKEGFRGTYNLIYMPVNVQKNVRLGYVFINFKSPHDAEACCQHLQGFKAWDVASENVCSTAMSDGIQAQVSRSMLCSRKSETSPSLYRPVLRRLISHHGQAHRTGAGSQAEGGDGHPSASQHGVRARTACAA